MLEKTPAAKPQNPWAVACVVGLAVAGMTVGKVVATSYAPPRNGGFNVTEVLLAGLGGGVGGGLGALVAHLFGLVRKPPPDGRAGGPPTV